MFPDSPGGCLSHIFPSVRYIAPGGESVSEHFGVQCYCFVIFAHSFGPDLGQRKSLLLRANDGLPISANFAVVEVISILQLVVEYWAPELFDE